ncbi:hypothetical protein SAMN05660845_0035 [Flavobacterium swingsii]|jgi:hypothetical protein|uniref:Uncharacterized protein n=1 Tax=Flavobacterium swingsii TaxID=498292 RepID=A0A1I0UY03_9FLAO|nr:hypothetical protein [Flavobacterium swingsii]SFA68979.1 hypothetical protein SAMN05660845_0035 [Flavobacterium swingsii]
MNVKNFIIGGIVGGIVDWLLGWLFYGIIFKDTFPSGETMNMIMITLGCFTVGFFISYIFAQWAAISNVVTGLKAGAVIGIFMGLTSGFFGSESMAIPDYKIIAIGVFISIIMCACVGASIAFVNSKLK